ncbi:hypothetical protein ACRYI5_05895 [Furfurilactobacillus sp. WILCCON 0119]|uniref:hypothetical protein n=1 Tax=Furfurilactobacillus entadae TaxID=2922307 RepID=UPI0035EAEA62
MTREDVFARLGNLLAQMRWMNRFQLLFDFLMFYGAWQVFFGAQQAMLFGVAMSRTNAGVVTMLFAVISWSFSGIRGNYRRQGLALISTLQGHQLSEEESSVVRQFK